MYPPTAVAVSSRCCAVNSRSAELAALRKRLLTMIVRSQVQRKGPAQ